VPVYVQEKGYGLDPRMRISILSTSKIFPRLNSVKTGPEAYGILSLWVKGAGE